MAEAGLERAASLAEVANDRVAATEAALAAHMHSCIERLDKTASIQCVGGVG